jgi:Mce-associated membrane protein
MTTTEEFAETDVAKVTAVAEDAADVSAEAKRGARLPWVLAVVALLLAGFGAWFTLESDSIRSSGASQNQALVGTGATAEVNSSITLALNRIFSYSYDKTEVTEQAAANVLRGKALATYNQLFAQVRQMAPRQKLVLSTRVVNSAVQSLNADHAQLLVFLDQSATRTDTNTTSAAASQLSVTAERQNGTWVITDLAPR